MSQSVFSASPPAYVPEDEAPETAPSGNDGRRLKVVAGILALLVLASAAWFFLLRGAPVEEPAGTSPVPVPGASAPVAVDPVTPVVPEPEASAPVIDGDVGNDPFKPLIYTVPETAEVAEAAATADGSVVDPAAVAATPAPVTPTSPTPITVTLVDVADDNSQATVKVDTADYTVKLGQVFATYYKALTFKNGSCATFQYGETPFAGPLCEGDSETMQ